MSQSSLHTPAQDRAKHRLRQLVQHLPNDHAGDNFGKFCPLTTSAKTGKSPNDVVIVTAVRTPIGKAKKGSFRDVLPENLLRPLIEHILQVNPQLASDQIGEVIIGSVLPPSGQVSSSFVLIGSGLHVGACLPHRL